MSDATELVHLDRDHPGFRDVAYRARRNEIARQAQAYREGNPVLNVAYSEDEQAVWRTVWENLGPLHERYACREYLRAAEVLRLSRARIPQLADVNRDLRAFGDFEMHPVAGLVTPRTFLSALGRNVFLSTQYIRHASMPLYTPEPDIVHELVGHAPTLASETFCALSHAFGKAALRANERAIEGIIRAYWYTLEFGVTREEGRLKAYGAGLLSSFGELGRFESQATLRAFDLDEIAKTPFDPTDYQAVLFVAEGFGEMVRVVTAWLEGL